MVRIGEHTLEVQGGIASAEYWIDGGEKIEVQDGDTTLGEFPVHFRRVNGHQSITRIDLGNGDAISFETYKDFVRVNVKDKSGTSFIGSNGLMGSYPRGEMIARDGSVMNDHTQFGQNWQVLESEPKLFHNEEGVQHPLGCKMPDRESSEKRRRRLGESMVSEKDARLACARAREEDKDACIFDVMATNDKGLAGSY